MPLLHKQHSLTKCLCFTNNTLWRSAFASQTTLSDEVPSLQRQPSLTKCLRFRDNPLWRSAFASQTTLSDEVPLLHKQHSLTKCICFANNRLLDLVILAVHQPLSIMIIISTLPILGTLLLLTSKNVNIYCLYLNCKNVLNYTLFIINVCSSIVKAWWTGYGVDSCLNGKTILLDEFPAKSRISNKSYDALRYDLVMSSWG